MPENPNKIDVPQKIKKTILKFHQHFNNKETENAVLSPGEGITAGQRYGLAVGSLTGIANAIVEVSSHNNIEKACKVCGKKSKGNIVLEHARDGMVAGSIIGVFRGVCMSTMYVAKNARDLSSSANFVRSDGSYKMSMTDKVSNTLKPLPVARRKKLGGKNDN